MRKLGRKQVHYPCLDHGLFSDSEFTRITEEVGNRYDVGANETPSINHILNALLAFCEASGTIADELTVNRGKIRSMRVLDIACGSPFFFQQESGNRVLSASMKPWLCRTLSHLGAEVVGTDLYYPDYVSQSIGHGKRRTVGVTDSEWRFVQRDLFLPDALDEETFKSGSFDFVNCQDFVGYEQDVAITSEASALKLINPQHYEEVVVYLRRRAGELLKDGGSCLFADVLYGKNDGRVAKVRKLPSKWKFATARLAQLLG